MIEYNEINDNLCQAIEYNEINNDLFQAIKYGCKKIVKQHLKEGLNINGKDKKGNNCVYYAVIYERIKILELLLRNKPKINNINKYGDNALHYAVGYNYTEIVKILLEAGADVNIVDGDKDNLLHIAVNHHASTETVNLLLKTNIVVNYVDKRYRTPLCKAIRRNDIQIVELLLKAGADLYYKDNDGITSMDYCVFSSSDNDNQMLNIIKNNHIVPTLNNLCLRIIFKSLSIKENKIEIPEWFPRLMLEFN